MARGMVLTDKVIIEIARIYLEHPDWTNRKIHKELLNRIESLVPYPEPNWPGYSVVQKELVKIRRANTSRLSESNGLDTPWSLASIRIFPVSPEAIPNILNIWLMLRRDYGIALTNREAQWISYLHCAINDEKILWECANKLSFNEILGKIASLPVMFAPGKVLGIIEKMKGEKIGWDETVQICKINQTYNYEELAEKQIKEMDIVYGTIPKEYRKVLNDWSRLI